MQHDSHVTSLSSTLFLFSTVHPLQSRHFRLQCIVLNPCDWITHFLHMLTQVKKYTRHSFTWEHIRELGEIDFCVITLVGVDINVWLSLVGVVRLLFFSLSSDPVWSPSNSCTPFHTTCSETKKGRHYISLV